MASLEECLASIEEMDKEIWMIMMNYKNQISGLKDQSEVLKIRLEVALALQEAVNKHERIIRFLRGEKIAPVQHSGEAVLIGVVGGGM